MAAVKQVATTEQNIDNFFQKWGNKKDDFKEDLTAFAMSILKSNEVSSKSNKKIESKLDEILQKLEQLEIENKEIKEKLEKKKTSSPKKSTLGNFASKKAKELAEENDLREEDLEGTGKNGKILLKDIKKYIEPAKEPKKKKKADKTKEKHPCFGINNNGKQCKLTGKTKADDGNWYCGRHIVDYQEKQDEDLEQESDLESLEEGDYEIEVNDNHGLDENSDEEENEESENENEGFDYEQEEEE